MGPQQQDFQTMEVNKFGEALYVGIERKLVEAIVNKLGLVDTEEVTVATMEFGYALNLLVNAGFNLNHRVIENGSGATLSITIYEAINKIEYDIKTTFSVTVE